MMSQISLKTDELSVDTRICKFTPRRREKFVMDALYKWNEDEEEKAEDAKKKSKMKTAPGTPMELTLPK